MSKRKKLGLTRKDWKAHKALTKDVKCANTAINYYAAVTITIERNVMATVPVASGQPQPVPPIISGLRKALDIFLGSDLHETELALTGEEKVAVLDSFPGINGTALASADEIRGARRLATCDGPVRTATTGTHRSKDGRGG